jgi:hypothetical protein
VLICVKLELCRIKCVEMRAKTILQVKHHYFQCNFGGLHLFPKFTCCYRLNFMNIFKMFRHQWNFPTCLSFTSAPHPLVISMYKFSFILNDPVCLLYPSININWTLDKIKSLSGHTLPVILIMEYIFIYQVQRKPFVKLPSQAKAGSFTW